MQELVKRITGRFKTPEEYENNLRQHRNYEMSEETQLYAFNLIKRLEKSLRFEHNSFIRTFKIQLMDMLADDIRAEMYKKY